MRGVLISFLLISGCGLNGTQRIELSSSNQAVSFGGSSNININFTFIQQLLDLCKQSILPEGFATLELYNQAVAQCVLNSTAKLNPGNNPLCQPGADLSGFTLDQQTNIAATCAALNGGVH